MIRAFYALTLPDAVKDQIARLQQAIPFGRPVDEDNLHLTLAFLGTVTDDRLQAAHEALESLTAAPFAIALSGVLPLGGARADVLAAGVAPEPALDALAARIRSRLAGAGTPVPRERFRPHVTFLRLGPQDAPPETLARILTRHAGFRAGPVPVTGFTLFRSHLAARGARHEALFRYPLDPADNWDNFTR